MTILTGASGAIPRNDIKRMNQHAELYYAEVRKRDGDIKAIAKNTGFSVSDIHKIKRHIFINEYKLDGETLKRFDPDYDMAVSWQRLIDGKDIQEMDIVMLKHELMEYGLMKDKNMSYFDAHKEAEKVYDYTKHVKELDLKEGIK